VKRLRALGCALLACALPACVLMAGCASVRTLATEQRTIEALASRARDRGAYRCAPEELALAVAHLELATHELEQGDLPRAREHLQIADLNARAAARLSNEQECGASRAADAERPRHDASWRRPPARDRSNRSSHAQIVRRTRSSQGHVFSTQPSARCRA
jgi:hypothetical protein